MRTIDHYKKHRDMIDGEIERLADVLKQATEAGQFMLSLSEEERQVYRVPQAWQNEPRLNYIYGMSGLF